MTSEHRFSPEMRQRFIEFYNGWESDNCQEYLRDNFDSFQVIAKYIQENRNALERWCANALENPSGDELEYDTVAELICLEHGLRTNPAAPKLN